RIIGHVNAGQAATINEVNCSLNGASAFPDGSIQIEKQSIMLFNQAHGGLRTPSDAPGRRSTDLHPSVRCAQAIPWSRPYDLVLEHHVARTTVRNGLSTPHSWMKKPFLSFVLTTCFRQSMRIGVA